MSFKTCDLIQMIRVQYEKSIPGRCRAILAGVSVGAVVISAIRGETLIPCITTSIARWYLQQFNDYPGSDEPSDSFVQIQKRFKEGRWVNF